MELQKYQTYLDTPIPSLPQEVEERGRYLSVILSRTGQMYADYRREYMAAKKNEIFETLKRAGEDFGASKSAINELIKAAARDEEHMMLWAEKIYKTAGKQLEWCRTLLSYAKAEISYSKHST